MFHHNINKIRKSFQHVQSLISTQIPTVCPYYIQLLQNDYLEYKKNPDRVQYFWSLCLYHSLNTNYVFYFRVYHTNNQAQNCIQSVLVDFISSFTCIAHRETLKATYFDDNCQISATIQIKQAWVLLCLIQVSIQAEFEHFRRNRLHNISRQPASVLHHKTFILKFYWFLNSTSYLKMS